jgi:S-adenosylmethionine:tRNA ribosyltransferase-isomerase
MNTALFSYDLPQQFIAQQPAEPRDSSRLLVLDRVTGSIEHRVFAELGDYLRSGDLLVANDSRVMAARLHGRKVTGGAVELLLLHEEGDDGRLWECMARGRGMRPGTSLTVTGADGTALGAVIRQERAAGTRLVEFASPVRPYLDVLGELPLPPYITEYTGDRERYQTVYGRPEGSAAAPTAGLHFTPDLLLQLRAQDVGLETVTLHIGLDTFKPVETDSIEQHRIHSEWAALSTTAASAVNEVSLRGGNVVAVGTTSARTLEWAATTAQGVAPYPNPGEESACPWRRVSAFAGSVDLFIRPGYRFRAVDRLLTNFHLPRSSLLMMVSAFVGQAHDDVDAGRRILLDTYEVVKREG